MSDITLAEAEKALDAAQAASVAGGFLMNITIVDSGTNLKAFRRMDGAWLGSLDIAMKKARTARLFDLETGTLGTLSQPGGPLFGIELSNGGLISFGGGIPIKRDGVIIGAIGVSGGSVDDDQMVAQAGVDAVA